MESKGGESWASFKLKGSGQVTWPGLEMVLPEQESLGLGGPGAVLGSPEDCGEEITGTAHRPAI